jgi:hypothetical protein
MLNACLTFSWPNKVPFDREASGIIRAGIYTGARIGAEGSMICNTPGVYHQLSSGFKLKHDRLVEMMMPKSNL